MRPERLCMALLLGCIGCHGGSSAMPDIPSPVKMARASIQPVARMVQAQGLVLKKGGAIQFEVGASAADSPLLRPGLAAHISDLQSGAEWNCRVTDVLAHASLETGASVAWLEPLSGTGSLKEGDFVSAGILVSWLPKALMVPTSAVLIHQGRSMVVVSRKDKNGANAFLPLEVSLGADSGEMTQVLKGLKEGDEVVTEGATGFLAPEFKSHPTD